jgi:divalent metal cation (Fe/Co/Zn/Cd) transporter
MFQSARLCGVILAVAAAIMQWPWLSHVAVIVIAVAVCFAGERPARERPVRRCGRRN